MVKKFDLKNSDFIYLMNRAIDLALLADGDTSPNPLVGAVVVNSFGEIVGEGFHVRAGEKHAEVMALEQAGASALGGSLFVTLEPCCHQGRTPPCTKAILRSGIKQVVVSMADPDPRVSGKGIEELRQAGIKVNVGLLQKKASKINSSFLFRVENKRPWGIMKWAMSFDGRIALPNGESKWISGIPARSYVHNLRSKCDAVIVGGGTLRSDNPLLTSRGLANPEPIRVVFSKSLDLPSDAQLWDTTIARTIIAYKASENNELLSRIPKGPEFLPLKVFEPRELMNHLASIGCNKVLWECGPGLASKAVQQGCVQEIIGVIAPKLLGGKAARTPLSELGIQSMQDVIKIDQRSLEQKGADWIFTMRLS
tara:strand:- start:9807 stop:10907 length:1101 start_codon:yes stop_codon:yes gene_type:complete